MIRTNVVTLTVIPAIAYRQKLPSGGSGLTICRADVAQPGIASVSKKTGEPILSANTNPVLFPPEAFSEALELTAGLPYRKKKGVRIVEIEEAVSPEEIAPEAEATETAAAVTEIETVVDGDDYQKIVDAYTDKKGRLSYALLNRDLIRSSKNGAQVRFLIEQKATADEICFEIAKGKFCEITGNAALTDGQVRQIIELLDEVSPQGVFRELNAEIRGWLRDGKIS